jgi:outer membrane receptor for ferrienterochelin and colicins
MTQQLGVGLDAGTPAGAGVYLQGLGGQRVLVLLDGQPLTGRINGNLDLSRVPVSMVERVEVVKGPQSTLYGSDALGGVINIITRAPPAGGMRAGAALVGGSQGRRDASFQLAAASGAFGWTVDGGARRSDLAPGRPGDGATYARRWNAAPALVWRARAGLDVQASALLVGESQRYSCGQLFCFSDNTQLNARAGASWRRGVSRVTQVVSLSRFDHLSRAATTATPASDSGARDVQQVLQAELTWSGLIGSSLVDMGVTGRREAIDAVRISGTVRQAHSLEPFAQATWQIGAVSLTPGARFSWNEQWGTAFSPRLAALWRAAPAVAVRASLGRGFRAPDFKELYFDYVSTAHGYAVEGNPDLEPETSTNVSAGVDVSRAGRFARLTLFHNRYRNFIDFVGWPLVTYRNVRRGSTRGAELDLGMERGALRAGAGLAWLRATDEETGADLLGRPEWSARSSLSFVPRGYVTLGASAHYTGKALVAAPDGITGRPALMRLDARATVRLPRGMEATVAVDNVLDRQLGTDWPGFTGRSVALRLSWSGEPATAR